MKNKILKISLLCLIATFANVSYASFSFLKKEPTNEEIQQKQKSYNFHVTCYYPGTQTGSVAFEYDTDEVSYGPYDGTKVTFKRPDGKKRTVTGTMCTVDEN